MLILADGGGGNGYNLRTWKNDLQEKLCDAFGLTITLTHYPPACSKWNPIEYRLFSHISMNGAGQPLLDLDVMLGFIWGTTTAAGLQVEAYLDQGIYRKGRKVTDQKLKELALRVHDTRRRQTSSRIAACFSSENANETASTPRSADRAGSPARVSQKREYFKHSPETIEDFALRLWVWTLLGELTEIVIRVE